MEAHRPERRKTDKATLELTKLVRVLAIAVVALLPIVAVGTTYAVIASSDAKDASKKAAAAVERVAANSATIDDLCQIAVEAKEQLAVQVVRTREFLESPAAAAAPGFAAYIEQVSLPQAIAERDARKLPPGCI